jgi:chromosome segregation ATPase
MSDASATKSLRERLATGTEDRLGRALSDLFDNPLLTGAVGRAFDAREKAAQAQELAMGALNLPSAADIERLTRRLRSLSQRLESIEDGVDRISRSLSAPKVEARLEQIEGQLQTLTEKLSDLRDTRARATPKRKATPTATPSPSKKTPARTPPARSAAAKRKG